MRINREFARTLADRLSKDAVRFEYAAIDAKQQALGDRVLGHIYAGRKAAIAKLGLPWVRLAKDATFNFSDGKRHAGLAFKFETEQPLPISHWNGIPLDLKDHQELMDDVMEVYDLRSQVQQRAHSLYWELEKNIIKAKTVKKLMELWPEAAEQISEVAIQYGGSPAVEVPLDAIFRRHSLPALSAPSDIIEVAA